jgi:hypothetical protein
MALAWSMHATATENLLNYDLCPVIGGVRQIYKYSAYTTYKTILLSSVVKCSLRK